MLKRFGQSLREASVTNKARNNGPLRLLVSERAKMIEKVVAAKATLSQVAQVGRVQPGVWRLEADLPGMRAKQPVRAYWSILSYSWSQLLNTAIIKI